MDDQQATLAALACDKHLFHVVTPWPDEQKAGRSPRNLCLRCGLSVYDYAKKQHNLREVYGLTDYEFCGPDGDCECWHNMLTSSVVAWNYRYWWEDDDG